MAKKTDLMPYEEILELWRKVNKQSLFVIKGFAVYMALFLASVVLSIFGYPSFPVRVDWVTIISAWLMCGTWIYVLRKYIWISNIERKRYREIENAITPELERIAREWYGKDWHQVLRECIEAHIPGDCPLCGAQ